MDCAAEGRTLLSSGKNNYIYLTQTFANITAAVLRTNQACETSKNGTAGVVLSVPVSNDSCCLPV